MGVFLFFQPPQRPHHHAPAARGGGRLSWISFYWGETIAEYKQHQGTAADEITAGWLDYFSKKAPDILGPVAPTPTPIHH